MIVQMLLAASFALPQAEFAKYHREITGREPAADAVVFAIDPSVSKSGHDAYAIQSNNSQLRITGSNMRSVWYGLYDLLERRGGCHWFWDGDVVPKRDAIDLSGLDVREEARFEYRAIRYFAHRGLTRFQAEHWGPEDWKREIDWCLKRRLNVFMLRIGQDDLFQRTFPETCAYPDASKDLPGHGEGYDNRTLFWSLEYRGRLRRRIQKYAFARGLMVPEDFGTMTHWYSRTPEDFLAKKNPTFLPQATAGYGEKNGLVWDIRDDKWADEYWKLTLAAVRDFGEGGDQRLLHTIGLGERRCFTNRQDNLNLKIESLGKFLARSHRDFPNAKNLLAGWDFYFTWHPEEVRSLVKTLDPKRDIIWDYEGDATRDYRPEMKDIGGNNFTKWGVVGKFPYTFSIFLAFEDALDIRANYPLIEARQKLVQDDPMCAGYIFWPESSHTDTLLLRYFTANAWGGEKKVKVKGEGEKVKGEGEKVKGEGWNGPVPIATVLNEFCRSRYGDDAAEWKAIWEKVIPISYLQDWGDTYAKVVPYHDRWQNPHKDSYNDPAVWKEPKHAFAKSLGEAVAIFDGLRVLDWKKSAFTERDAIDLARTTADRLLIAAHSEVMRCYHAWKAGQLSAAEVIEKASALAELATQMPQLLALHTDYSLAESYDRLDAVEKIANPNFSKVLLENAGCGYCLSHQYEFAEYWYKPEICEFTDDLIRRVRANDRSALGPYENFGKYRDARIYAKPLAEMRPTLPRDTPHYCDVLYRLARTAAVFVQRERPALKPLVCPAPKKMTMGKVEKAGGGGETSKCEGGEWAEWISLDGSVPVSVACDDAAAADWVARHWKAWFGKEISVRVGPARRAGRADVGTRSARRADPTVDESYSLSVAPTAVSISAKTLAGVRYAMATLRQLSMANRGTLRLTHYIAPVCDVEDEPSVAWRGLHYCWFPDMRPSAVERFIRMAAYLKFNYVVLENWGSFRSERYPWLGWSDGSMTKAELRRLRAIAEDLGVTLVPQVNVFGHASLARGCAGKHSTLDFAPEYQPLFEPIMGWNWCLSNPESKRVLGEFVAELHEAFGNPPYFHLGCDEAQPPSCPECAKGSYSEKVVAHIRAMAGVLEARGARAIIWHDMFLRQGDARYRGCYCNGSPAMAASVEKLPKSVIIADWNYNPQKADDDHPSLRHFHDLGFDVLTCPWDDTTGIDSQGRFARNNPWCGYLGTVWHHYYGPEFRKLLVHGAAAAWGADPKPFREPWDARIMTLLRQVQWDMPIKDRVESGVFDFDLPPQPAPKP